MLRPPILICLLLLLLTSGSSLDATEREDRDRPLRYQDSRSCGRCHREIYQQWKSSMHAQSTALDDPIHAALYRGEVGPPDQEDLKKGGGFPVCLQCHAPTAARDGKTDLTAQTAYREGVHCVTCHSFTRFKGTQSESGTEQYGTEAYEFSDTTLQGPSGKLVGQVHPENSGGHPIPIQGNATVLRSNAACLGCHALRKNAHQVPLCQTGDEVASSGGNSNCLSCHMPVIEGLADHSMMGGHSPEMVSKGLQLTLTTKPGGDLLGVTATLTNLLPHKFPTGAPFRNVYLILTAHDGDGGILWKNNPGGGHPLRDDPQAVLMTSLGDAEGKPSLPPQATQILSDRRLGPGETRDLAYLIPAQGVAYLKAEAFYDLVLPPMKKKLAAAVPEGLLRPRLIATAITPVE